MDQQIATYGSWRSPINAEMMAASSLSLSDPRFYKGEIFWHESRPKEKGRGIIVRRDHKGIETDLIPLPYSARSGVHEYGGRCFTVADNCLFFVNSADQQIYSIQLAKITESKPKRLTPVDGRRYADLEWSDRTQSILAVCEDHRKEGEPVTSIVNIPVNADLESNEPSILVSGSDFYAYPRVSYCGEKLCWIEWNHPDMPWFNTTVWQARLEENSVLDISQVKSIGEQAIFQPQWHADGSLYFCSDKNNCWNLYRCDHDGIPGQVSSFDGECGLPLWQFGMQTYAFIGPEQALCAVCHQGIWQLHSLDLSSGISSQIKSDLSSVLQVCSDPDNSGSLSDALVIAASPISGAKIFKLDVQLKLEEIKASSNLPIPEECISVGKAVEFPTTDSMAAKGFFYAPKNPDFYSREGLPPLVVLCHGGPTAATTNALNLKVQFWTSRGFAVFDVNYRGSTGYGRQYRNLLEKKWGIYDVEDACAAAQYACDQGWCDPQKTIIRGSSAGGLTVLSALTFHNIFAAGSCLYGIGDLRVLAGETHKFEARYADSLIAPWPEGAEEYDRRSPIHHTDKLNSPVIFFQGLKDKVVPPNQAEMMVEALKGKGVPVSYQTYAEEGHGFKSAETIKHSFNAELAFYGRLFGFETDSSVTDLEIYNLSR